MGKLRDCYEKENCLHYLCFIKIFLLKFGDQKHAQNRGRCPQVGGTGFSVSLCNCCRQERHLGYHIRRKTKMFSLPAEI